MGSGPEDMFPKKTYNDQQAQEKMLSITNYKEMLIKTIRKSGHHQKAYK